MKIFVLAREDGTLAWPYVGYLTSEEASDNSQESGTVYVSEIDVPALKEERSGGGFAHLLERYGKDPGELYDRKMLPHAIPALKEEPKS